MIWMFLLKKAAKKAAKKATEKMTGSEGGEKKQDPSQKITAAFLDGCTSLSCCFLSLIVSVIIFLITIIK